MISKSNVSILILAGGLGKRMKSELPKVLHKLGDKPMLVRVLESANALNPHTIYIVVGKYKDVIQETLMEYLDIGNVVFIDQPNAQGTGHALQCALPELVKHDITDQILVLSGDVPLLTTETMQSMIENNDSPVKLMTTRTDNPTGYGRIIMNAKNTFQKITEEKDCNVQERQITLINAGVYAFNAGLLCKYLPLIQNNNAQNEYYLTDIFEIMIQHMGLEIGLVNLPDERSVELTGINTKEQLEELNNSMTKP